MVYCCIIGCKSRSERKQSNITFHRFPPDVGLRKAWRSVSGRQDWKPRKFSRVCSIHFEQRCFRKAAMNMQLYQGSIPSLYVHEKTTEAEVPDILSTDVAEAKREDLTDHGTILKAIIKEDEDEEKKEEDTPRSKRLKEKIWLLRNKVRHDGIKIKCLQNKIRHLLRKQAKRKNKDNDLETEPLEERGLKRKKVSPAASTSATDTAESTASEESSPKYVNRTIFEGVADIICKTESMHDEGAYDDACPSADQKEDTGLEEDIVINELKLEFDEDPLMVFGESN